MRSAVVVVAERQEREEWGRLKGTSERVSAPPNFTMRPRSCKNPGVAGGGRLWAPDGVTGRLLSGGRLEDGSEGVVLTRPPGLRSVAGGVRPVGCVGGRSSAP